MSEHPLSALARNSYDALAKGDLDSISPLLTDDVVFHVPGRGPLAGDYRGKEEVLRYLKQLIESTDNTLRFEPESFLVGDDHVAAILQIQGERGGKNLDDRGLQVFKSRDGKISERWSYPQDPYTADEFFA
ncbi:nuclear transport factor 2 family protein [Streptosporangium soli]|nr:nuclear transport factor 2 family protein [Streptosporangium sp. KLBMP 9127]